MLLIGSRAARFHYPSARKPKDFDFIATKSEVHKFLKNFKYKDTSSHEKKIGALVDVHGLKVSFEFELAEAYGYYSSKLLYLNNLNDGASLKQDKILGITYHVASPESLFLLKKSHITFPIHWKKNITDYLYLKNKLNGQRFPEWWEHVFHFRFNEIKNRVKKNSMKFDVDNSDFFKKSEKFVNRVVEHDSLHQATCFYDEPLFLSAKDDLSKAALSENKVNVMSHDNKIKMIQEECMALSLERYIIPCLLKSQPYNSLAAYEKIASKMVYNYLPEFLRFFAADHYPEILDLKIDYVKTFLSRHPSINNIIQQKHQKNQLETV
jgi:hypothetical protein